MMILPLWLMIMLLAKKSWDVQISWIFDCMMIKYQYDDNLWLKSIDTNKIIDNK